MDVASLRAQAAKWAYHGARLFLGGLWLYASHDKILHPEAFAQVVYNYQVLPDTLINFTAVFLPWFELLLGICLIAGIWISGAAVLSTALLTAFAGTLVFNLFRGIDIQCGCFSMQSGSDPANYLTVLRDLSFVAVSVYLMGWYFSHKRALPLDRNGGAENNTSPQKSGGLSRSRGSQAAGIHKW
jgi:uncharacterized membrane protein YphA (DoxX/SURF4 family)